jgi:four helix bundle protein
MFGVNVSRTLKVQDFRRLRVWQESKRLTVAVYALSARFPGAERYGLTSQMRRAAASIGANIAEGCGRGGRRELARFLRYACGSASELEHHMSLAADLGLIDTAVHGQVTESVTSVRRMLAGLMKRLAVTPRTTDDGQRRSS